MSANSSATSRLGEQTARPQSTENVGNRAHTSHTLPIDTNSSPTQAVIVLTTGNDGDFIESSENIDEDKQVGRVLGISLLDFGLISITVGPSRKLLWDQTVSTNRSQKNVRDDWVSFPLLTRASGLDISLKSANNDTQAVRLGLPSANKNNKKPPSAFYVGYSAQHMTPVFLGGLMGNTTSERFKDDAKQVKIRTEPKQSMVGSIVIWAHDLLIPGNITALKRLATNPLETAKKSGKKPENIWKRVSQAHADLLEGKPASPLCIHETKDKPPSFKPYYVENTPDLHWVLRWPKLAFMQFPATLVDEIRKFLAANPRDLCMDLNTALAGTMIYFDIEQDTQSEGWARGDTKNLPRVSLAVFLLYFPHMLRFVAESRLSRHFHPLRFAHVHYTEDINRNREAFEINEGAINVALIRDWCRMIQSMAPSMDASTRTPVYPYMFPGSGLNPPSDAKDGIMPGPITWGILKLPDVRTLGLPTYHHTTSVEVMVALPQIWAEDRLPVCGLPIAGPHKRCDTLFKPLSEGIRAVTGRSRVVGPVWNNVEVSDVPMARKSYHDDGFDKSTLLFPPREGDQMIGTFEQCKTAFNQNRLAFFQDITDRNEGLKFNSSGYIYWDTMELDVYGSIKQSVSQPNESMANTTGTADESLLTVNKSITSEEPELILEKSMTVPNQSPVIHVPVPQIKPAVQIEGEHGAVSKNEVPRSNSTVRYEIGQGATLPKCICQGNVVHGGIAKETRAYDARDEPTPKSKTNRASDLEVDDDETIAPLSGFHRRNPYERTALQGPSFPNFLQFMQGRKPSATPSRGTTAQATTAQDVSTHGTSARGTTAQATIAQSAPTQATTRGRKAPAMPSRGTTAQATIAQSAPTQATTGQGIFKPVITTEPMILITSETAQRITTFGDKKSTQQRSYIPTVIGSGTYFELRVHLDKVPVRATAWNEFTQKLTDRTRVETAISNLEWVKKTLDYHASNIDDLSQRLRSAEPRSTEMLEHLGKVPRFLLAYAGVEVPKFEPFRLRQAWVVEAERIQKTGGGAVDVELLNRISDFLAPEFRQTSDMIAKDFDELAKSEFITIQQELYQTLRGVLQKIPTTRCE